MLDSLENSLISADEVKERLADWNFSGRCDNINLYEIETAVRSFGEVADAQVFRRDRNNIEIDLAQRKPAVRFIKGGTSHYADCLVLFQYHAPNGHGVLFGLADERFPRDFLGVLYRVVFHQLVHAVVLSQGDMEAPTSLYIADSEW